MEQIVDRQMIRALVNEAEPFWAAFPMGWMQQHIQGEIGFHEESGLKFTAADIPLGQFYVGLSVLTRDMLFYLAEHPRQDAGLFHEVVSGVHATEASIYDEKAFPDYKGTLPPAQVAALPVGLALAAASGYPTVTPLRDNPQIVHEWTFKPGKRLYVTFLQEFGTEFKEVIVCGPGGFYERSHNQSDLIVIIAEAVLNFAWTPAPFWVPLSVYISLLLVKTGLKTFCEPD